MIVSEQLNYTKTRWFHAIFMPVIIEFSRCIGIYSSAKFEYLIENLDDIKKIDCDDNEYYILQHNIEQIRRKIINGEFLDKVLKKIMSNEEYSN